MMDIWRLGSLNELRSELFKESQEFLPINSLIILINFSLKINLFLIQKSDNKPWDNVILEILLVWCLVWMMRISFKILWIMEILWGKTEYYYLTQKCWFEFLNNFKTLTEEWIEIKFVASKKFYTKSLKRLLQVRKINVLYALPNSIKMMNLDYYHVNIYFILNALILG